MIQFWCISVSPRWWNKTRGVGLRYSDMQRVLAQLNGVPLWFQKRLDRRADD